MTAGLASLVLGYVLSQFYRSFLAVLAPVLGAEIGAGPDDLATSLGLWFLAFALMQIPVGHWLDRHGPRRVVPVLLALGGGGGAAVFAAAGGPGAIHLAMVMIGIGCSPVLMGAYVLIARTLPPALFGTMAGAVVAVGSLGNIAGASPLVWVLEAAGWRTTLWGLCAVTLAVAALVAVLLRDPPPVETPAGGRGSVLDVLRLPGLGAVLALTFVGYAAAAGLRGVWAGPFLSEVHGAGGETIGWITLAMGLAMVAGNFVYGAADRIFGSHKVANVLGTSLLIAALGALALAPNAPLWQVTLLLCAVGFFGASYPALMAHGRAFLPPHLVGRGVTLLNMFSIAGVGIAQFASRPLYRAAAAGGDLHHAYTVLFLGFLLPLALGLAVYLASRDPRRRGLKARRSG